MISGSDIVSQTAKSSNNRLPAREELLGHQPNGATVERRFGLDDFEMVQDSRLDQVLHERHWEPERVQLVRTRVTGPGIHERRGSRHTNAQSPRGASANTARTHAETG